MMDLRKMLLEYREKAGLTQPQMADFVGIGERTYQSIENSGDAVKIESLLQILQKLGIHPAQFFADDTINTPEKGKELLRLKAVTDILVEYVLLLRSTAHNRTLDEMIVEYEQHLTAQLMLLRTGQI